MLVMPDSPTADANGVGGNLFITDPSMADADDGDDADDDGGTRCMTGRSTHVSDYGPDADDHGAARFLEAAARQLMLGRLPVPMTWVAIFL